MAGDAVQLGMVIDERRRPEEIGAVGGAAVRFGRGFRGAADELRNGFAEGLVEGTGGADELRFGGDDVVPGAAVHDARGENERILRIVHAGDERLERHHDAGGGDDSIMALMGALPWAACPWMRMVKRSLQAMRGPSSRLKVPAGRRDHTCMP